MTDRFNVVLPTLIAVLLSPLSCAEQEQKQQAIDKPEQSQSIGPKDYDRARPVFWKQLYRRGGKTLYCGEGFGAGYQRGLNIEHVFPMSWVTKTLNCGRRKECRQNNRQFNRIEADFHNLFPSRKDVNDARGSYRFGDIKGEKVWSGDCDFEVDQRRRVAEPRTAARGEIARAMFYMAERYDLKIFRKQAELLKRWNQQDQPSKDEQRRNDLIERIQGNRNPYIDNPATVNNLRY